MLGIADSSGGRGSCVFDAPDTSAILGVGERTSKLARASRKNTAIRRDRSGRDLGIPGCPAYDRRLRCGMADGDGTLRRRASRDSEHRRVVLHGAGTTVDLPDLLRRSAVHGFRVARMGGA